jgi:osmoprotectant transport system permease protein
MNEQLAAAFRLLPLYLGWHVVLSASALGLGLLLSAPLAVLSARNATVRWPVLAVAGLIQTIPSLALLALFYPLLLALSAVAKSILGHGFPALGFLPSLLALTLYSMLPMLRNGVAGLMGIDLAVVEAARGVGMTDGQRLWQVEAPLAAPVAMAGVRTASVWVIGTATLATPVGQTSLGDYIFSGLQTENWLLVLFGCAASAGLAFTVDQLLGLIETGLMQRNRRRIIVGLSALAVGIALAAAPLIAAAAKPPGYVLGAKNFSEQYILADLMADRLERTGARVTQKDDLGSVIAFRALAADEIDAYVDYSGTLWTTVLGRRDNPPRAVLLAELSRQLKAKYGVVVLGSLGFENAYALAMKRSEAQKLGVRSIADLAPHAPDLTLGSDLEFLSRIEWRGLQSAYDLHFKAERQFQPTFMYKAVTGGEADVISAFSSDGRIAADDLVVLTDPKGAIPPYDAVILLAPKRANDTRLHTAFNPLIGRVSVEAMRRANLSVDRDEDKQSPAEAARQLAQILGLK